MVGLWIGLLTFLGLALSTWVKWRVVATGIIIKTAKPVYAWVTGGPLAWLALVTTVALTARPTGTPLVASVV